MRLLICGGRDYDRRDYVFAMLDVMHKSLPIFVVIEGGARGADRLGREWALANSVPVITEAADWAKFGRAAGHIRNKAMLNLHNPDVVLAFPGGTGTANMLSQAEEAGVITVRAL